MKKRLYSIWHNMKTRCYNPNTEKFQYYGGKGIEVCEEWRKSFQAFYSWALANGYRDDLTLDRLDSDKNYCPENCRWADMLTQNNNTSKNHYITHNGETKTAAEWARDYGICRSTFNNRIRRGWTFEQAAHIAVGQRRRQSGVSA